MKTLVAFSSLVNSVMVPISVFTAQVTSPFLLHQGDFIQQGAWERRSSLSISYKQTSLAGANCKCRMMCTCFLSHLLVCWFCSSCKFRRCFMSPCSGSCSAVAVGGLHSALMLPLFVRHPPLPNFRGLLSAHLHVHLIPNLLLSRPTSMLLKNALNKKLEPFKRPAGAIPPAL